jgi:HK97 family phage major capsid protein
MSGAILSLPAIEEIRKGVSGMIAGQKEQGAIIEEQGAKIKEHAEQLTRVETYLKDRKFLATGRGVDLPGLEAEKSAFSLVKAMVGASLQAMGQSNAWVNAGFEKEVLDQTTKKAMDTGTAGAGGGYVVPVQYSNEIIQLLRAKARVIQAGATVLDGLVGSPVMVPKQTASGTVYWIGQNPGGGITLSDGTFGNVQMTPKTMAMRTQFSNLLNILSNPRMEQLMREDFAKVSALELDRVALRGSGSSNQPLGVNGVAGLQSLAIGTNGGTYTFDTAAQAMMLLDSANALDGKLGFITHPRAHWKMRRERIPQFSGDTAGAYVVPPIISSSLLNDMLGAPMFSTTQLPINLTKGSSTDCTEVYCGDWSQLLVGIWGNLEILATNIGGNAWAQNAMEVRLIYNVDIQVRHGESFALCNDARTT